MAYKYWTEADITQLKRLVGEGKPNREIAHTLGRTLDSINIRKSKLGICSRKTQDWTKAETTRLTELLRQGKSGYEIADALGRTYKSVGSKKQELGITNPNPYEIWSEWELHRLRRYCKRGYSLDRIWAYYPNRTRCSVENRVKQMTRFWFTPEQKEARRLAKEKEWEWRVW